MASKRDKIRLVSSAGTGHFYDRQRTKKTTPEKMEIKYDPVVRTSPTRKRRSSKAGCP